MTRRRSTTCRSSRPLYSRRFAGTKLCPGPVKRRSVADSSFTWTRIVWKTQSYYSMTLYAAPSLALTTAISVIHQFEINFTSAEVGTVEDVGRIRGWTLQQGHFSSSRQGSRSNSQWRSDLQNNSV